ncbi:MAG: hypothetical protein CXT77_01200 [uncultured DHVE6 group euryarchaeote]|jgi:DNA helicase HerA-like ATPase|nr:MAG: hypothetical protein CXT77_01200 [uncultured DHVE6 group euryarchaeote]
MAAIGTVSGRTSTTSFKFVVNTLVNKWDYVSVTHPEVGPVLNQVVEVEKVDNMTYASCVIIGHRTERGFLRQPRTPFSPGSEVSIADDNLIKSILDLRMNGIYLGRLQGKSIKAFLDPKKLITKHLAVLAKSGAGKSYAVGVILEELLDLGVPVVILDPHGEYSSIKTPNTNKKETDYFEHYGIQAKSYGDRLMEFAVNTSINIDAHQIRLKIPNDPFALTETLPFKATDAQRGLLYNVINDLVERKGRFEFDELIKELEIAESTAKWRLIGGIQQLEQSGLFSHNATPINEIVKPGQLTIINFKGASQELQEIVARSLLTNMFEERKLEQIPPGFLIIDEAHNYCPERGFGEAKSSKIIRTIASEGRKFGLGVCIISQRPARVDKSVLSQCSSQIALQVTNPSDLAAISRSFEGVTAEAENEIRNLPIGKAMIIGATDFPIFVDIRVRKSLHGGTSKSFDISEAKRAEFSKGGQHIAVQVPAKTQQTAVTRSEIQPNSTISQLSIFEPRISKKEIETIEKSPIKSISFVMKPVLSTICEKSGNTYHLVFDLEKFSALHLNRSLKRISLGGKALTSSGNQQKIMNLVNEKPKTPLSEVFVKSGLSFSEVDGILKSLVRQGTIRVENKIISATKASFDPKNLNFILKPKYLNLQGEKRPPKIPESRVVNFLKSKGLEVRAKKLTYLPFYKVVTESGTKYLDSLSYSMRP